MNNFKRLSAIILAICTAAAVFTSCTDHKNPTTSPESTTVSSVESKTEIIADKEGNTAVVISPNNVTENNIASDKTEETIIKKETVTVEVTDKNGEASVSVSEKTVIIPARTTVRTVLTTVKSQTYPTVAQTATKTTKRAVTTKAATTKATLKTTVPTTKKQIINDTINEKSVGISMLTKTDPVIIGNQASIFIQGTPGKTYSIEFYETPSSTAKSNSLEDKKADANGIVSWIFEIRNTCNLGKRKIIVKENNSSNYLETSITVK